MFLLLNSNLIESFSIDLSFYGIKGFPIVSKFYLLIITGFVFIITFLASLSSCKIYLSKKQVFNSGLYAMISFQNLRKKYQNNAELIYKDYVINSEDFIAITGPSGSGKSTLLDLISNLSSPTSGTIEILGKEMSFYEESEKERTNLRKLIGIMIQTANFYQISP